jgi:cytochrome P450
MRKPTLTQQSATSATNFARTWDFTSPEHFENPHEAIDAVRAECPVAHSDALGGYWFVSSYEEAYQVLADPTTFSSSVLTVPPPDEPFEAIPVSVDPPKHTAYRKMMTPLFSPAQMARLEDGIRARARALLTDFVAEGGGDFVEKVAIPLPSTVFLELLGLPSSDLPRLLRWKDAILRDRISPDPAVREKAFTVDIPGFFGYAQEAVNARRGTADPPSDVLTGLVFGTVNLDGGRSMSDAEILNTVMLFIIGGLDTVTNVLTFTTETLANRPDLRQQILDDPSVVPAAVEEFLRYWSIVTPARYTTVDAELGGQQIKAGDLVSVCTPAAGRDPAHCENPNEIRFDRRSNRHLAFGAGPHRCLGSHLARIELAIALQEMRELMPNFSIMGGTKPEHVFGPMMECTGLMLDLKAV